MNRLKWIAMGAILGAVGVMTVMPLLSDAKPTTAQVMDVLRWRVIHITGKDDANVIQAVVDHNGFRYSWSLTNALPDESYIEANAATARAYLADYDKTEKAAIKEVSPEVLKAVVAAIVKTVNLRLPADKKITAEEMTAAIKEALP